MCIYCVCVVEGCVYVCSGGGGGGWYVYLLCVTAVPTECTQVNRKRHGFHSFVCF